MTDEVTASPATTPKRCGWLFNIGLTVFIFYFLFVNAAFDAIDKGKNGKPTNLSRLPWVNGNDTAELLTGLVLASTLIFFLTLLACITWNRLVVRLFRLAPLSLGETFTAIMWAIIIYLMVHGY